MFSTELLEYGASHILVTYSYHLGCMWSANMFRVIYKQNKASCRRSERIIISWLYHFLHSFTIVGSPLHEFLQLGQFTIRNRRLNRWCLGRT